MPNTTGHPERSLGELPDDRRCGRDLDRATTSSRISPEPIQRCVEAGTNGNNPPLVKGNQTITFAAPADRIYGDPPFTVVATGGASGNPVTFTASGACTSGGLNGATITLLAPGSCSHHGVAGRQRHLQRRRRRRADVHGPAVDLERLLPAGRYGRRLEHRQEWRDGTAQVRSLRRFDRVDEHVRGRSAAHRGPVAAAAAAQRMTSRLSPPVAPPCGTTPPPGSSFTTGRHPRKRGSATW